MPGLPIRSKKEEGTRPEEYVEKRTYDLTPYQLDNKPTGMNIAVSGKSKTGKTLCGLSLGYLCKDFIPQMREAGLELCAQALEDNIIPSIDKIILIETESAFDTQIGNLYERRLFKPILEDKPKIVHWKVENVKIRQILDDIKDDSAVELNPEDIQNLVQAANDLFFYIDSLKEVVDNNTLVILDSGSKAKLILDVYTSIVEKARSRNVVDLKRLKKLSIDRWTERNTFWDYIMSELRDVKGWTYVTFKVKRQSEWVIKAYNNPKLWEPVWCENTEYYFDQHYQLKEALDGIHRSVVQPLECRYKDSNPDSGKVFIKDGIEKVTDRLQFLQVIENMIRIMRGDRDDWWSFD